MKLSYSMKCTHREANFFYCDGKWKFFRSLPHKWIMVVQRETQCNKIISENKQIRDFHVNKVTLYERQHNVSDKETILMNWCNWASIKMLLMNKLLQRKQNCVEEKKKKITENNKARCNILHWQNGCLIFSIKPACLHHSKKKSKWIFTIFFYFQHSNKNRTIKRTVIAIWLIILTAFFSSFVSWLGLRFAFPFFTMNNEFIRKNSDLCIKIARFCRFLLGISGYHSNRSTLQRIFYRLANDNSNYIVFANIQQTSKIKASDINVMVLCAIIVFFPLYYNLNYNLAAIVMNYALLLGPFI